MGTIIVIEEYRKKRCLESLLAAIGLPSYCEECDECGPDLLIDADNLAVVVPKPTKRRRAKILHFPLPGEETKVTKSRKTRKVGGRGRSDAK